jgi:hypothetical protein
MCRYRQYGGTHLTDNKKAKRSPPQNRMSGPSRTRLARWSASTALRFRLVRGTLDGSASTAPCTARHLDHTPTRTRLVRPTGKTPTRVTPGQALDPLTSPTPGQKSEHLMRLPTTTNRYGHNQDRRGSNAGVSPHYFSAHPVMGGESSHCTHLTVHCLPSITLEGGYDKTHIPQSRGFGLIRSTSTRPRSSLDAQHSSRGKEGRYGTAL